MVFLGLRHKLARPRLLIQHGFFVKYVGEKSLNWRGATVQSYVRRMHRNSVGSKQHCSNVFFPLIKKKQFIILQLRTRSIVRVYQINK